MEECSLETGKENSAGTPYYGRISAVNNFADYEGSFYFEAVNGSDIKGFWVLQRQDLVGIAKIAKGHNLSVRINADVAPLTGSWLKATQVYGMALETDSEYYI